MRRKSERLSLPTNRRFEVGIPYLGSGLSLETYPVGWEVLVCALPRGEVTVNVEIILPFASLCSFSLTHLGRDDFDLSSSLSFLFSFILFFFFLSLSTF